MTHTASPGRRVPWPSGLRPAASRSTASFSRDARPPPTRSPRRWQRPRCSAEGLWSSSRNRRPSSPPGLWRPDSTRPWRRSPMETAWPSRIWSTTTRHIAGQPRSRRCVKPWPLPGAKFANSRRPNRRRWRPGSAPEPTSAASGSLPPPQASWPGASEPSFGRATSIDGVRASWPSRSWRSSPSTGSMDPSAPKT